MRWSERGQSGVGPDTKFTNGQNLRNLCALGLAKGVPTAEMASPLGVS
jgi:hypothetical protein